MSRSIVAPVLAAAAVLALASCANPRAEQAVFARTALVGLPEAALLSCAGVPDRSRAAGGRDYLTYEAGSFDARTGPRVGVFGGTTGSGIGLGAGFGVPLATEIRSDYCEATFILENGHVAQLNYNTPTGPRGSSLGQCYDIVQNCVPPQPVQ